MRESEFKYLKVINDQYKAGKLNKKQFKKGLKWFHENKTETDNTNKVENIYK